MNDCLRRAQADDVNEIQRIYAQAREFMARSGNPNQWGKTCPPKEQLERDIANGCLYVITGGDAIRGVFYFAIGEDPTYANIYDGAWHSDRPYGTIHRIAGDGSGGIVRTAVEFGKQNIDYLRIDTHEDNKVMQRAVMKQGFRRCGIIYIEDGTPRIAYDRQEGIV